MEKKDLIPEEHDHKKTADFARSHLPSEDDLFELAELFKDSCREVCVADTVEDGVDLARDIAQEQDAMVCAFGSLYICGQIRSCFGLR